MYEVVGSSTVEYGENKITRWLINIASLWSNWGTS